MRTSARDPRYRYYKVYLDGQDISGYVTDADDVEGWVRCVVTNEQGHAYSTPETDGKPLTEIRRGQVRYEAPERTPKQQREIAVIETVAADLYRREWYRQCSRTSMFEIKSDGSLILNDAPSFANLPYEEQLTFMEQADEIVRHVRVAERELACKDQEGCQCQE